MTRFADKVALVTGGRTGIGKAIAERLQDEGARVFTAQRSKDDCFESHICDLASPESCELTIAKTIELTGHLDVLINNAGIMQEISIEEMTLKDWQRSLAINLTAPFLMIQKALPYLRQTRGSIVNIGSVEGHSSNPNHAAYCASKAGLHALTRAVAVDHSQEGIRCNTVAPGWIDTELNLDFIEKQADPAAFRSTIGKIHPVGRTGTPADVAALVAFLAAEESSFITGQTYIIDGGRTAKLSLPH